MAITDFTFNVTNESFPGANDGTISIIVAVNATEPVEYSKDAGATYQTSRFFTNLAPGNYEVWVKDADNDIIQKTINVAPGVFNFGRVFFDKNPISFTKEQSGNNAEPNYRIQADIQVQNPLGSSYVSILKVEQEPDSTGFTTFNIRSAFRNLLKPSPPAENETNIRVLTDRFLLAKIVYDDLYDDLVTPTTSEETPFIVVLGGLEKRKHPSIDFFNGFLHTGSNNVKFLSWAPTTRTVDTDQEDYTSFFVVSASWTALNLKANIYYDDDTSDLDQTIIANFNVTEGTICQIPIGPANSGVKSVSPLQNITKYELWLENQAADKQSEVLTFNLSAAPPRFVRYYLFQNSLGSFEVLRTTGKREEEAQITKSDLRKYLPSDYQPLDGEYETYRALNRRVANVSTGFMVDKYTHLWFQDFALSRRVFDITSGERVPVTIDTSRLKLPKDKDYEYYHRFKALESYEDESFTPQSVS